MHTLNQNIKLILSITILLSCKLIAYAQNTQDTITIISNSEITILNDSVFIKGCVFDKTNYSYPYQGSIFNSGYVSITGDIVNNSGISLVFSMEEQGQVHFVGDSLQRIMGNNVQFNIVYIKKSGDTLYLDTEIIQNDSLHFQGGIIDLNGNDLFLSDYDLHHKGRLGQESDSSHIMGLTGYVYTQANMSSFDGYGMGIKFQNGSTAGNITIQRGHTSETTVTDGSVKKYFNLMPGQAGNHDVIVHYLDTTDLWDVNCNESDFKLWSSYTNGYYYEKKYGGVDTTGNVAETNGEVIYIQNPTRITVADHICDVIPVVNIGDTLHICNGSTGSINAYNNGSFFVWSTGETSQIISVNTAGMYYVTVTDPRGCFNIDSVLVVLDSVPHTNFSFNSPVGPCPGTLISFNNTTTVAPEAEPLSYLWQFGDGNTATEEFPQHAYVAGGTYTITLTAIAANSCAISHTATVHVFDLPEMSFTFNNACKNKPVILTNTTPNAFPGLTHWNLGNGDQFFAEDTAYFYTNHGTYAVQLIATDNHGCTDTITQNIEVYPLPIAGFTTDDADVCLQNSSVFHNSSSIPYGNLSYQWQFGNGFANTTPNPIIVYDTHGNYTVQLIATSSYGCSDTAYNNVIIRPIPNAEFSFSNVCEGDTVFFTNESSIDPSEILTYHWTFGDGSSSNIANPKKLYSNPGSYTVNLEVTSEQGCSESIQKTVQVYANPNANFLCQPVCFGNTSMFQNMSLPNNSSLTFYWEFGDGSQSDASNPQHYYNAEGEYLVSLIAESGVGCSDTIDKIVRVYPTPVVDLGDNIFHCFNSYVLDAQNSGANYIWSNNAASQTITVNQNGDYSVTVTNNYGCSASDQVHVTLNAPIVVSFDGQYWEVCDSTTLNAGYPGADFIWSTGASTQSITVLESGIYAVTITNQGCTGVGSVEIVVHQSPQLNLGDVVTECEGLAVVLDAENEGSNYLWSTNQTLQQIEVNQAGTYSVTVTDINSCTVSDSVQVVFNSLPIDPFPADTIICGTGFLNAHNQGAAFVWNTGSTAQAIEISQSGNYWVTITGGNSCSLIDTVSVTAYPRPLVDIGNDTALCNEEILVLSAGNPNCSFLWNTLQTSATIQVVETGNYTVQVTNEFGCSSEDSVAVVFHPNPIVHLGADLYLCANQMALLSAGDAGQYYAWGSDFGFSSFENAVIVADSGKYWVDVTNEFGCTASDTVIVQFSELSLTAYFLAASEAMRGDTIRFVDVSYPEPTHYLWDFKDGVTSTEAIPQHVFYVEGNYLVTLMVSNNICSDTISKPIQISGTSKIYIPKEVENDNTEHFFEILSEKLYPNPNDGSFTYELQLNQHSVISLSLFDLHGKMIYQEQIDHASYVNKSFNFNHLDPGIYILRMNVLNKMKTYKIVIM
ncbi:MAG: PKD domain-containing protein [Bacteroidales bacterium]|nr:PKD domain-containing protein [Bacteroidales bacterium]